MKGKDERYPDYPLFKGLQRPLEFMGIQGRYTYWAAGVAGGAIVGFIIAYCLAGFVVGLVVLYAIGLPYMYIALNGAWSLKKTIISGCLIFLPFDALKIVVTTLLCVRLLPVLRRD